GGLCNRLDGGCIDFSANRDRDAFYEEAAMCDEKLMEEYLESGEVSPESLRRSIAERKIFPCFFGSALKMSGIEEFLKGLDFYAVQKNYPAEFGARVFKITEEQNVRLTHMKITGGSLKVRSVIGDEKINQIRIYSGTKFQAVDEVFSGAVCAVTGLAHSYSGQGLGAESNADTPLLEPVLTYKLILPPKTDLHTALTQMRKLEEEDPQLHVVWNEQAQEIHVQLMGEIQLEILKTVIAERFGYEAEFGTGSIVYKETVSDTVEGVGHYEPLRHYAEVHLLLEPAERGSGLHFTSDCHVDDLDRNWQRLILTHLEEKTHIGVLTGSPITDMKITLIAGRAHLKHTEGGDFRQATYRAVRQGLRSAKSVLLEPWYNFTLEIPSESVGRALSDMQKLSAEFEPPETLGETAVITGSAPVSEMQNYRSEVISYTHGKGRISLILKGYFPCHNAEKVIEEIGYDCDSDLENTADSVFCSHGAGFVVKWDEVPSYAHISGRKEHIESADEEFTVQQVSSYRARIAEDKELMEIFERTYGKIKRDERHAMHTEKHVPQQKPHKAKPLPTGPEYLLVDGYNIIFAWDELNKLAKENLDLARTTLINRLCNYQGFKQNNVIVVFDAYRVSGHHREVEQHHNVSVVYTKESETADTYIEKVTHELSKSHRVRVATSDGTEQIIILGNGAFRVSAAEFEDEVKRVEAAIREIISQ
ncbi:MAG: TetM/TetW/TetO/TetS family tetracycline resistance ribosomal protection protein, partial [Oscillospiraceae bacterium]|nr:TetM/TetW/TetO/TetS family tetracycline resistance ribosomal protection protein [Oscillospiraceae bacterium]